MDTTASAAAEGYAFYAAEAAEFAEVSATAVAEAWAASDWVRCKNNLSQPAMLREDPILPS
ncbi:MAG: hypothetical protein GXY68_12140 [Chloroflexi bacterium]|nr:hypothetical protein [Chloroflexota bacterium]